MTGTMSRARIQILNWRQYGEDESYARVDVFAAGDETTSQDLVIKDYGVHFDEPEDDEMHAYINDDLVFEDGHVLESREGRKFRVTVTEVTE